MDFSCDCKEFGSNVMITFSINLGSVGDVLHRFYFVTPVGGDTANYDFVSFFNQLRECAIL